MKTKNLLFIGILFSFFFTIKAQALTQIELDSLMAVWNNASQPDTNRLNAVYKIAWEGYRFKNPDSAFYYAQLQYDLANSIKNKEFMVLALNIQGDSYLLKGDPDKAFDILSRGLKVSEELSNKKPKLNTLGNLSRVFEAKGEVEKTLEYNLQILKLSKEIQDKEGIGKSLTDIGQIYAGKGDLVLGLDYLNRAKKIFEEINHSYNLARVRSITAQIYLEQGYLEEALTALNENIAYFEKTGNKTLVAGVLSNIGAIYSDQGENDKALENFEKALTIFEEIRNIPYIARLSQNIGRVYQLEGNLELSLEYFTKSLKLSEEMKDKKNVASAKNAIGIILAEQGNYNKAISYSTEALTTYQEMEDAIGIRDASHSLANSYKATERYKKAFEMNTLYFQMRDSLNSKENQKAIIELQFQSDYEKQKAIDDTENEKRVAIEKQKKKNQQILSAAIGLGLLLVLILALGLWHRYGFIKKTNIALALAKDQAERSEKYKEQFLANMSHEIRTPMHAISGMIKILKRNEHPSAQDVFLNAMQTSSENLVVILNDVLDLSKIEAGKIDVESIPMNPVSVIENIIQILKYKAEEKGLLLSYKVANDVPSLVMGDPTRLNQILANLTGNAIKFTENGKVDIDLQVKNEQLQFQINDTGIGISKDQQENIFAAFEQAKASTTRYYGGTGLGLSISKQLVELQKGKIWVESAEGTGSTFYVALPLTIAEAIASVDDLISEEKLKTMATSLEGIRVLLAEDNPFNQMIAPDDLSFFIKGITIDTVENGTLAIEKFKTHQFDLILMDVQMPVMNGFEATKKIREIERLENRKAAIPIIAMTASLLKTEIDNCMMAGMDNYIPKPYTTQELIGPIFKELRS